VRLAGVLLIGVILFAAPAVGRAQSGVQGAPAPSVPEPSIGPFELQRLFDSYALLQAQQFLRIGDEQFAKFLPRFKALQDARRQGLQQRTRVLNQLRKALNDSESDEQIRASLRQLQDIDDRAAAETRKASEAVDQVLDLGQQAKFRIFEEQMERRKLELVTIARQQNRANNPNRPNNPNRGR
jgi:hypothetical protein